MMRFALPLFPCVASERFELVTSGITGGWKSGRFTWPLWTPLCSLDAIRAALTDQSLTEEPGGTGSARRARGIAVVLRSAILRSDQGGYGSFTPADVV